MEMFADDDNGGIHVDRETAAAALRAVRRWGTRTPEEVDALLATAERLCKTLRVLVMAGVICVAVCLLGVWWIADVCLRQLAK